ncbi:MAG TPA: fatty acid desaturase [Croceibacterium sp.]
MSTFTVAPPINTESSARRAPTRAELHARIAPFTRSSFARGGLSFVLDVALFTAGIAAVLLLDNLAAKLLGGLLAGLSLVNLGALAHEAAHGALVPSKRANKVLGVAAMTMVLFNYRLWIYDHHVLHHAGTNVKGHNSFSPLSPDEYASLSPLRRALYRAYRSEWLAGVFLYYLFERWPGVHLYPGAWLPARFHASAWRYTALQGAFGAALLAVLIGGSLATGGSVALALLCGFALPYTIWLTVFSMTVGLQHTHPRLPWYRRRSEMAASPAELSVQLLVPGWFNFLTHYALEHPVHHVSAMIPHYHLRNAQAELGAVATPPVIAMPFTVGEMRGVFRRCKLFHYERQVWVDFQGRVTAVPDAAFRRPAAAEGLPYSAEPDSPGVFFPSDRASSPEPTVTARREDA